MQCTCDFYVDEMSHGFLSALTFCLALISPSVLRCYSEDLCHHLSVSPVVTSDRLIHRGEVDPGVGQLEGAVSDLIPNNMYDTTQLEVVISIARQFGRRPFMRTDGFLRVKNLQGT